MLSLRLYLTKQEHYKLPEAMKRTTLIICLLTMAMMACKPDPQPEPDPNIGGQPEDTTGTVVKKYLVKEYWEGFIDQPIRIINWNEDFSRIIHITTSQNTMYQLDFDFEYYGVDSMRVALSQAVWAHFPEYTCFFDVNGRIDHIDYYSYSGFKQTKKYSYDAQGRLISVIDNDHNIGQYFVWEGENVCEIHEDWPNGHDHYYYGFTDYIHPYYTLPYFLLSGDMYQSSELMTPFWKNWYTNDLEDVFIEHDEDGYVTCSYRINEEGEWYAIKHYEYAN